MDHYAASLEIKVVDIPKRIISGYAAVHHSVDRVHDIIDPGASVKAVARLSAPSDVGVFVGHATDRLPIGIPQVIQPTSHGLYTETYILKGHEGDNLLDVAKDLRDHNIPLGLSIGYRTHDSRREMAGRKQVRRIMDYGLKEYSFAAHQTIAHPEALMTSVKALSEGSESAGGALVPPDEKADDDTYRMEARGDRFHVVESDGTSLVDFSTEVEARAALKALMADASEDTAEDDDMEGKTTSALDETKAVWSTAYMNDLADANFLFIEDGGQKDDEGKTVPRSLRHFPYKDADGKIDLPHLRNAVDQIPKSTASGLDKAHLQARARVLLERANGGKTVDEPDEWKTGAALAVRGFAYQLLDLSDTMADELKAMALLGEETKGGARIRPEMRTRIAEVTREVTKVIEHAERIDRGEDGKARVAWFKQQFAFADV